MVIIQSILINKRGPKSINKIILTNLTNKSKLTILTKIPNKKHRKITMAIKRIYPLKNIRKFTLNKKTSS